jgi:hypothetical protein
MTLTALGELLILTVKKLSNQMTWQALITSLEILLSLPAAIIAAGPRVEVNLDANWQLHFQNNSLSTGLGTNWIDVPGLINIPFVVPIDPAMGTVFYRLILDN